MVKSRWYGTLIVVSPTQPTLVKFRFTPKAFLCLGLVGLISFLAVVAIGHTFPSLVRDRDRARLADENLQLKVKNKNAQIGELQLQDRVSKLEQQTQRIQELLEAE